MRRLALALAVALAAVAPAAAQPTDADDLLRAVREATARLDYPAAEARAREALARPEGLPPDALVEIHAALGVVLHARGADVEAREQFRAALSLNPGLVLDSVLVSPRTLDLLEAVRAEAAAAPRPDALPPAVRYVVVPDRRVGAAWRSAVLPGWGQLHKGDRGRGIAFAAGVGAAAVGTGAAHVAYAAARDRYDRAPTTAEAERLYGPYNRLHRLRVALGMVTAAGWALSIVEALATGAPSQAVQVAPSPSGLALRVRW